MDDKTDGTSFPNAMNDRSDGPEKSDKVTVDALKRYEDARLAEIQDKLAMVVAEHDQLSEELRAILKNELMLALGLAMVAVLIALQARKKPGSDPRQAIGAVDGD